MRVDKTMIVEANNPKEAIHKAIPTSGYEGSGAMEHEFQGYHENAAFFSYSIPGRNALVINFVSSDIPNTPFYRVETFYSD